MGAWIRAIFLIGLACAAGVLLGRTLREPAPVAPLAARQAPAPAPGTGTRIWYPATGYYSPLLSHGQRVAVRSILNITRPMRFGNFVWDETNIPNGPIWVRIDLAHQLLSVFRGGHEIGSAVILYGSDGKPTPTGNFTILEKDADHYSRSYDAPMPYMLRLTSDGVAIHGSSVREGWATHGCIGVPLDFARRLFATAKKGDPVVILPAQSGPGIIKTHADRYNGNEILR